MYMKCFFAIFVEANKLQYPNIMKRIFFLFLSLLAFALLPLSAQQAILREESMSLNTSTGTIYGKLTLPDDMKSPSVVALLIAGSGPTDMDGNTAVGNMKNNSLKYLAEGLAKNGIPVLRFDKRGVASSASAGLQESELRFEHYIADVEGWIDLLMADKRFKGVVIVGHSEGALIGLEACRKNAKAKGYVSLAGAGCPAYEIIEAQVAAQMTPEAVQKQVADINASLKEGREVSDVPVYLQALFRPSVQPYLISWYRYDPQKLIALLKVPMLIVQGRIDIQVSVQDAELLKQAAPRAELLLIDGMNHVLKTCDSTNPQEQMKVYADPSLPLADGLVDALCGFIRKFFFK